MFCLHHKLFVQTGTSDVWIYAISAGQAERHVSAAQLLICIVPERCNYPPRLHKATNKEHEVFKGGGGGRRRVRGNPRSSAKTGKGSPSSSDQAENTIPITRHGGGSIMLFIINQDCSELKERWLELNTDFCFLFQMIQDSVQLRTSGLV